MRLLHSSRVDQGLARFLERKREDPDDVCGYYFPALAYLSFDIDRMTYDAEKERGRSLLDEGIEAGESVLDSGDAGLDARYCVGAMYGLRAGDRLLRSKYFRAAFDGKKSRRIMLDLRDDVPQCIDCGFWLGMYDYLADVLPGLVKFFKTLLFLPGGDKVRGLEALKEVTERGVLDRYSAFWMLHSFQAGIEKDPQAAFETLKRTHEAYPDSVSTSLTLARTYAGALPADRARGIAIHLDLLERIGADLEGFGTHRADRVALSLSEAYFGDLRPDAALGLLRPLLESARGDAEREPPIALALVSVLGQTARVDEAVKIAREVASRHPDAPSTERLTQVAASFDAETSAIENAMLPARRLGREGRFAEADAAFRALLDEHGDRSQIHFGRAELYFDLERDEEAEKSYRKVLESGDAKPAYVAPAYLRLGNLMDLAGSRGEARVFYREAEDAADEESPLHGAAKRFLKEPYARNRLRIRVDR